MKRTLLVVVLLATSTLAYERLRGPTEVPASSSTLSSYTSDAFTDLFFKRF